MDVQQLALPARQPSAALNERSRFWGMPKRGLALILANALFWQPLLVQAEGIVASGTNTSVGQAGNGVPVVNIAAPNASGLSHNQYQQYNVDGRGVILNNATGQTQSTQLGGIIVGNQNLKGQAASTILNEVTSANASQLNGYTEVAGQSARVIVANPYGISCNGCGFINTPRVTLTTGKPVLDGNGQLTRFNVQGGSVSIDGAGLNAGNVDQFDIITRSAKINAELHANKLNVITGRNDVDANTLNATALADDGSTKPELAIDSSALGGMYAGAVKLVGTEAGVGVKLAGNLAASAGDIQIDANGKLTMAQTAASGDIVAKARDISVNGPAYAGSQLALTADGTLNSGADLVAGKTVVLTADQLINNGHTEAGVNADNTRNTSGTLTATARKVVNRGTLAASDNLTTTATETLDNQTGKILSEGTLSVKAGRLDNRKGTLSSARQQTVTLDGDLDNSNGTLVSDGGLGVIGTNIVNTGGTLSSVQAMVVTTGRLDNDSTSRITSGNSLKLDTKVLNNLGGLLSGWQSVTVTGDRLDNTGGTLVSNANVTLNLIESLTNTRGSVVSGGDLLVQNAASVNNRNGRLTSQGLMTLFTSGVDNRNEGHIAGSIVSITSTGLVQNGTGGLIHSQSGALELTAATLNNDGGTVQSAGDLTLDSEVTSNVAGSLVAQNGDLTLSGSDLDNRGGVVASLTGMVSTDLSGKLHNGVANAKGGAVQGRDLLLVAQDGIDNQGGGILAQNGGALLRASAIDNRNGAISSKHLLQVRGASLDNSAGQMTGDDIDLDLSGTLTNRNGIIESGNSLLVKAARLDNTRGQLRALGAGGSTLLTLNADLDNSGGRLESASSDLKFAIGKLLNIDGSILHVGSGALGLDLSLLQAAGGSIVTNGSLSLTGDSWTNSSELQAASLDLNIGSFTQTATGELRATNRFTGRGANWINNGLIATDGTLDVRLTGGYSGAGSMTSQKDLNLVASQLSLDTANARLAGGGSTAIDIDGILNNSGRITSGAGMQIDAAGVNNFGTLGAADSLTVTTPTLLNQRGLIFSGANMGLLVNDFTNQYADVYSLGSLQISRDAAGAFANTIINRSGTLASDANMLLAANSVQNIRDVLSVDDAGIYSARIDEISCRTPGVGNLDCGGGKEHHVWKIQQLEKLSVTAASAASSITSGGNLTLRGGDFLNSSSTLAASGELNAVFNNFNNIGVVTGESQTDRTFISERTRNDNGWEALARRFTQQYWAQEPGYDASNLSGLQAAMSAFIATTEREATNLRTTRQNSFDDQTYAAVIQAGGPVSITAGNNFDNSVVRRGFTYVSGGSRTDTTAPGSSYATIVPLDRQLAPDLAQQQVNPTSLPGFSLPTGQNGLFRLSDASTTDAVQGSGALLLNTAATGRPHQYLIETNPALTDLRQFLSSSYLLDSVGYNHDRAWKRLGDGYYEQRLIQQAVVARTGQRFINGLNSDEAMFRYLMDNAIAGKAALNLSVGVGLSSEQVAALTHDIVWMEDQVVRGEHVLVPVLYLAQANNRLAANGALIQGSDLTLIAGNRLNNAGTLHATGGLRAVAGNNLINEGLIQSNERLDLQASNDLINRAGGVITGRDLALTSINRDVTNERTVVSHKSATGASTWREDFANSAARVEAGNNLAVSAGRDVNNVGGSLQAGGNVTLGAGRDANIVAAQSQEGRVNGPNHTRSSVTQLAATVSAGQDIAAQAVRDIAVTGSQIEAKADVAMSAGNNLDLSSAANEQHYYSRTRKVKAQEDHVTQVMSSVTGAGSVALSAGQDMTLTSSKVGAGAEAYLYAGNDLNLLAAQNSDYSYYSKTKKGSWGKKSYKMAESESDIAVGSIIESANQVVLSATRDIKSEGAKVTSDAALDLSAGRDIVLANATSFTSQAQASSKKGLFSSKSSSNASSETSAVGTELKGQSVSLAADNDVRLRASAIYADSSAKIAAGQDVDIGAAQQTSTAASASESSKFKVSWAGEMSLQQKTSQNAQTISEAKGSSISADTLAITSGRDAAIRGSTLVTDGDTRIDAGRNLEIVSAENTREYDSKSSSKKAGEIGSWWQSSLGVVKLKQSDSSDTTTQTGSQIASLSGNVSMTAGERYNQFASQVVAPKGNISIAARQVDVVSGFDLLSAKNSRSSNKTAIGGSINVPLLDAARSLQQAAEAGTKTNDPRMQGLAALNAAMSAKKTYDAAQDIMQNGVGFKVSLNLSNTQSRSESTQSGKNVVSSSLAAGGDVDIRATGAGQNSTINIVGSSVQAGNDVNLKSDGDINLISAQNTATQKGTSSNSGWSVGIGFTVGGAQNGFTLDLAANKGQGKSNGDDVTHTNTQIKAGNKATLDSGRDTSLKGAVVAADQVQARVGRDLNIESLQDTSEYKSKRTDSSVGVSICIPPFCYGVSGSASFSQQKMQSDYASVAEQSGIKAGNGGFQVEVKGNTGLNGGVIASSDQATANGLNTLVTGTLTSTDIKNKAEYDAISLGLSGGIGEQVARNADGELKAGAPGQRVPDAGKVSANTPIALFASGDASSTTRSGISGAAVTITNEAGQQALTGKSATETVAAINTDVSSDRDGTNKLKPIFDAEEIQTNFEITSKFIQNTGVFLEDKISEVNQKNNQAREELAASQDARRSPEERQTSRDNYLRLKEEARQTSDDWGPGSTYRQITTALVAGVSGNVGGSTSQFAQNMLVNYVQQQGSAAIGDLVTKGLKEGSAEHAALHAILGCAGAAASRQGCSAGALGGAASSVLTRLFSDTDASESDSTREAKRNVIASLVTGIAAMSSSPSAATTASNAAIANVDNNWLATQQEVQYQKEYDAAQTAKDKLDVWIKWQGTSLRQDVLTGSGIAKGFTDGMADIGLDTLNSAASLLRDPVASFEEVKAFVTSPEAQRQLGKQLADTLAAQVDQINIALDQGGDANAEELGKKMGQTYALIIGTIASGGGGSASKSLTLAKMGIDVSSKNLEKITSTVKLADIKNDIAQIGKVGRDSDVPLLEPVARPGETASLPSYYREDSSAGAMLARPENLPDGYRVVINTKTGSREVVSPEGVLYTILPDGGGLRPKAGGNLAQLVKAEGEIGGAKATVPSKTEVQELEVDSYKNLKAREVVGDGLEHDHIPSFAALRTAKEAELGRPLTELETKTLYQNSTAVEVPRDVHIAGPTYGGKNTHAQIQQDAADLCGAVCRDTDALRANLNKRGYDSKLVDETVQKIVERNRKAGVIK
jgi:filamentous hemagglutinin